MNTHREQARSREQRHIGDTGQALPTILRGEELLEEAREVAQRISGRVHRVITERSPGGQDRQCAAPPEATPCRPEPSHSGPRRP
jgi:hypothetical protein